MGIFFRCNRLRLVNIRRGAAGGAVNQILARPCRFSPSSTGKGRRLSSPLSPSPPLPHPGHIASSVLRSSGNRTMPGKAAVTVALQPDGDAASTAPPKSCPYVLKKVMDIPPPNILEEGDDGKGTRRLKKKKKTPKIPKILHEFSLCGS